MNRIFRLGLKVISFFIGLVAEILFITFNTLLLMTYIFIIVSLFKEAFK